MQRRRASSEKAVMPIGSGSACTNKLSLVFFTMRRCWTSSSRSIAPMCALIMARIHLPEICVWPISAMSELGTVSSIAAACIAMAWLLPPRRAVLMMEIRSSRSRPNCRSTREEFACQSSP